MDSYYSRKINERYYVMRTLLFLGIVFFGSVVNAQEWVQYVPEPVVIERPPVVYTVPQPPVVVNKWVPYYYNYIPVVETRRRWFLRRERLVTYPYPVRVGWFNRAALYYGY